MQYPGKGECVLILRSFLMLPVHVVPSFPQKKLLYLLASFNYRSSRAQLHEVINVQHAHEFGGLEVHLDTDHLPRFPQNLKQYLLFYRHPLSPESGDAAFELLEVWSEITIRFRTIEGDGFLELRLDPGYVTVKLLASALQ